MHIVFSPLAPAFLDADRRRVEALDQTPIVIDHTESPIKARVDTEIESLQNRLPCASVPFQTGRTSGSSMVTGSAKSGSWSAVVSRRRSTIPYSFWPPVGVTPARSRSLFFRNGE